MSFRVDTVLIRTTIALAVLAGLMIAIHAGEIEDLVAARRKSKPMPGST
jgi:hypothetical protein